MALIDCPDCEKEVSSKAKFCPNCGYPVKEIVVNNEINIDTEYPFLPPIIIVIFLITLGLFLLLYLHTCTDTFLTKEDFIEKAERMEMNALGQVRNYGKDGDVNRLYGAAEYYKDAIKYHWKAIAAEDNDHEFDEATKWQIEYLNRRINDYYK